MAKGLGWEIIKCLPYVHVWVCTFVTFLRKPLYFFHLFTGSVDSYENMPVQYFGLILKNKMAAIADCFKFIKKL